MANTYQIKLHRQAAKQLKRFPKNDQKKIAEAIRQLGQEPRPAGAVNLREVLYRLRVEHFRVIYAVFEDRLTVVVIKTARRSEATYKDLKGLIERAERLLDKE